METTELKEVELVELDVEVFDGETPLPLATTNCCCSCCSCCCATSAE
jgi:hypothetical protein